MTFGPFGRFWPILADVFPLSNNSDNCLQSTLISSDLLQLTPINFHLLHLLQFSSNLLQLTPIYFNYLQLTPIASNLLQHNLLQNSKLLQIAPIFTWIPLQALCCGYGADGMKTTGYDCVIIPGALKGTANNMDLLASEFCGRQLATAALGMAKPAGTVCCKFFKVFSKFLKDFHDFLQF